MRKMPRRNSCEDIGWQHCIPVDGNKKIVRCNYCGKVLYGGINRLKQHLAKIRGDAAPCTKVNEEITRIMRANLEAIQAAKERKRAILQGANITTDFSGEENTLSDRKRKGKELVDEGSARGSKGKSLQGAHCLSIVPSTCSVGASVGGAGRLNSFFEPRSTQLKLKSFWDNNQARHKAHIAISDFFYHCAIPFNSINSQYFKKMLDVVGSYGPGLKPPSGKEIAGILLKNKVLSIRESFKELKASWANTGCTVMSDGWEDGKGKTLINFLVYCPRGIYFVRSVDASDIVKDPKSLFKLLDEIVKEVGEENVVQVVTENSANYVAAGRLLEANRKNIFWTPCVAHSLDLVLESIGKMKKVADCLTKGKKITKFIYNHSGVLSLMRYHTGGKDLLRPGITRFATNFLTLQSLVEHRAGLKRMILCDKWKESYHTKTPEAREVEKIILDASFWRKVEEVQKSVIPLVRVLRMVDGDEKPTMGYIYEAMDRAKLAIKEAHEDERKYGPYWRKIDERWESQLHHPLHAAAHFLNPAFRYRVDIPERPELQRGLNDCIVRLEPDKLKQIRAAQEIDMYRNAQEDFGSDLAVRTRDKLTPAAWWQSYGMCCPTLQRIAIRILSQTCTSSGCERNWSSFDQIHTKKRNRLAQERLNDLVYVHYNLRLKDRQMKMGEPWTYNPIRLDNIFTEDPLDEWVVETEIQAPLLDESEVVSWMDIEYEVDDDDAIPESAVHSPSVGDVGLQSGDDYEGIDDDDDGYEDENDLDS